MKKVLLLMALFFTAISFAQNTETEQKAVGNTNYVMNQDPDLHVLAEDVNAKHEAYQLSLTGSRNSSTEAAQALNSSLDIYISALQTARTDANAFEIENIDTELDQANALKSTLQVAPTKSRK